MKRLTCRSSRSVCCSKYVCWRLYRCQPVLPNWFRLLTLREKKDYTHAVTIMWKKCVLSYSTRIFCAAAYLPVRIFFPTKICFIVYIFYRFYNGFEPLYLFITLPRGSSLKFKPMYIVTRTFCIFLKQQVFTAL